MADSPSSDVSRADLKEAAFAGARWLTIGRLAAECLVLISSIALARLLSPTDFGHAAVAMVAVPIAAVLAFEGIGSPLVQRAEVEDRHLSVAATLALAGGVLLAALCLGFGLGVAPSLFDDQTAELLQIASLAFVISGVGVVPRAQLQRRLDFKRISLFEVVALLPNVVISIALAAAGAGPISLVVGALALNATMSLLFVRSGRFPRPSWDAQTAREIVGFGVPATMSALTYATYRNVDYAIIGARLGPTQLGFYYRAFHLGVESQQKVSGILGRLAFPLLSRAESAADMRALRARIVRIHTAIIFPLLLAFIVTAPDVVPFVFGDPWEPAVVPAQILAVAALASPLISGIGPMMMAAGRPGPLFAANLGSLLVYGLAIFFTAPYGLEAVCAATIGVNLVKLVALQHLLLNRILGIPNRQVVADAWPALASALALLAPAVPLQLAAEAAGVPVPLRPVLVVAAALAAYLATMRAFFPGTWADLRELAVRAMPRRRAHTGDEATPGDLPPRIAVTNAVASNSGDAAILKGVVKLLQRAFGSGARIVIYEASPEVAGRLYPELRFEPLPFERLGHPHLRGRGRRALRKLHQRRVLVAAWLWGHRLRALGAVLLSTGERERLRQCSEVDLVVSTGGTYLVETYSLEAKLFELRLALALRKPLVLYTQSLGPFRDPGYRRRVRSVLSRAELVLLRDERSRGHLLDIGVPGDRLMLSADAAFVLGDVEVIAQALQGHSPRRPRRVALSVRRWGGEDAMARYTAAIGDLVSRLVREQEAEVTFLSTCQGVDDYTDDSETARSIAQLLPDDVAARVIVDSDHHSPEELLVRLREFDAVVSTRMHVAILSLSAGVPVVPIAYEFKTAELFTRLGLGWLVTEMEEADGVRLAGLVDRVLDDRVEVCSPLFTAVLEQRAAALASAAEVRTAYARATRSRRRTARAAPIAEAGAPREVLETP